MRKHRCSTLPALLLALAWGTSSGVLVSRQRSDVLRDDASNSTSSAGVTFSAAYHSHHGRGIWKWTHYLAVYQRHFAAYINQPVALLEIGVQSGGSIDMFHTVMGSQCHYYGMDINANCEKFVGPLSSIFLGDQSSPVSWNTFFTSVVDKLDIIVDDGGHQAHQMLVTLQQTLPHLSSGGMLATEDIHGVNDDYLTKFLNPAADALMQFQNSAGNIASVHMYPYMLLVQRGGGSEHQVYQSIAPPTVTVSSVDALQTELPQRRGQTVGLANAAWPTFFTDVSLKTLFGTFYDLNGGVVVEVPAQCHDSHTSNLCKMVGTNTPMQSLVSGVHIYPTIVLVEVAAAPPAIDAQRMGDVWIPYA